MALKALCSILPSCEAHMVRIPHTPQAPQPLLEVCLLGHALPHSLIRFVGTPTFLTQIPSVGSSKTYDATRRQRQEAKGRGMLVWSAPTLCTLPPQPLHSSGVGSNSHPVTQMRKQVQRVYGLVKVKLLTVVNPDSESSPARFLGPNLCHGPSWRAAAFYKNVFTCVL